MSLLVAMLWVFLDRYRVFPLCVVGRFISVNLLLAGVNLLPALPLDGSRLGRCSAWAWSFAGDPHHRRPRGCMASGVLGCAIYGPDPGHRQLPGTWPALAIFLLLAALREWLAAHAGGLGADRRCAFLGPSSGGHQLAVSGDAIIGQVMRRLRPGRITC